MSVPMCYVKGCSATGMFTVGLLAGNQFSFCDSHVDRARDVAQDFTVTLNELVKKSVDALRAMPR